MLPMRSSAGVRRNLSRSVAALHFAFAATFACAAQNTVPATNATSGAPAAVATQKWPADAPAYTLHMIGNAHIDAPWLWPLSEANAVVHSTFRSALDRMKETPDLTMTTSSSQFYEWVEHSDPAMLDEIRQHVKTGRWNAVGGWWVEPDVNVPNGESLVRQGLYGQRSLQRIFGRRATVGYNPDSFGHTASLPQILKLQGMKQYVFMRPNALEKPAITQNLFQWQGIDGTRALTYRIPLFYDDPGDVRNHMQRTLAALAGQPEHTDMEFFGIGDHGGGPTKENIRSIEQIRKEPGAPRLLYSTPERYFAAVAPALPANIQVYRGDLQHHSVGTYTGGSDIKKLNRSTEAALMTAEKFAALGNVAWGADYPREDLTKAWKRLLLLQFHDALAATTLPSYFEAEHDSYGRARDVASDALYTPLQRLAWQVATTDPDSKYLVVFNPHAWPTQSVIEYDLGWEPGTPAVVEDDKGKPMPFQFALPTAAVQHRQNLVARVDLPALGYRQIRIRKTAPMAAPDAGAPHASEAGLENEHVALRFAADSGITLIDKNTNRSAFREGSAGLRAVVLDDNNDTWAHRVVHYDKELGEFHRTGVKVVENGPLRAWVREQRTYGSSRLTLDWLLYAGSRQVEVRATLDWHEHLKMLKFSFPVNVEAPKATYEIAYGAMERATEGEEDPGQRWVDVTGTQAGKPFGLAIVNDAKYGYSVSGSDLRVSVARGAVYANHEPSELKPDVDYNWMDQGVQHLRMLLVPHAGSWQDAGVVRLAEELNTEVPIVYQGIHPGSRAPSGSLLSVDATDVVVEAVKLAEDNDDIIVRSYETAGRATKATLQMPFAHTTWTGNYRPFEIKTLRVQRTDGRVREVNALEE